MTGIVGYFLKSTMNELKSVKETCYETKTKVQMIEVDYLNKLDNQNQRFDMLNQTMRDLIQEIKALRDKINS
jgi:hypothetical protein